MNKCLQISLIAHTPRFRLLPRKRDIAWIKADGRCRCQAVLLRERPLAQGAVLGGLHELLAYQVLIVKPPFRFLCLGCKCWNFKLLGHVGGSFVLHNNDATWAWRRM